MNFAPRLLFASFAVIAFYSVAARAEVANPQAVHHYRVSLLTVTAGAELDERLGHSALAVEDLTTGSALAYNFGTFGETENVTEKFLHKQLKFWVAAYNPGEIALRYRQREVTNQELALDDEQAALLSQYLAARVKPENRDFEYDLFTSNCVTPIRDALDMAMHGALRRHTDTPSSVTYRQAILRDFASMPLLGAFSALIYGPYVDAPRTRWEMLFLPDALHDAISELKKSDSANAPSFVLREKKWRGDAYETLLPLPNPYFIGGGVALLILVGLVQLLRAEKRASAGRFLAFLGAMLALVGGVLGSAIYYLGFMAHVSMHHNANRFLFNPLDLLAVPFLLLLSVGRLGRGGTRMLLLILFGTTVIAAGHAIFGHTLKQCIQDHFSVVVMALSGRAALLLCVSASLLVAQKGRSPNMLPAGR